MNKVKTIALDVDGVLLDFTRACDEYVKKNLGIEPIKKLDGFNLNFISMKIKRHIHKEFIIKKLLAIVMIFMMFL